MFEKKLPNAAEYVVGATNEKDTGDYTSSSPQKLRIYTAKGAAYRSSNGNTYLDLLLSQCKQRKYNLYHAFKAVTVTANWTHSDGSSGSGSSGSPTATRA